MPPTTAPSASCRCGPATRCGSRTSRPKKRLRGRVEQALATAQAYADRFPEGAREAAEARSMLGFMYAMLDRHQEAFDAFKATGGNVSAMPWEYNIPPGKDDIDRFATFRDAVVVRAGQRLGLTAPERTEHLRAGCRLAPRSLVIRVEAPTDERNSHDPVHRPAAGRRGPLRIGHRRGPRRPHGRTRRVRPAARRARAQDDRRRPADAVEPDPRRPRQRPGRGHRHRRPVRRECRAGRRLLRRRDLRPDGPGQGLRTAVRHPVPPGRRDPPAVEGM